MVDVSNADWSVTDASNISPSPNGWPNGTFPNQVEPIGRQTMGAIKRWWERAGPALPTTGSANAYIYTPTNTSYPTAYVQGDVYCAIANFTNTGAATININGLGAVNIFGPSSGSIAALSGGEIASGQVFAVGYDGTKFQLLTPTSKSTSVPKFLAYPSTSQNISNGSETQVTFNTEAYDTHSYYDNSTYRFTPLIAGKYRIYGSINWGTTNALYSYYLAIAKNGTNYTRNGNSASYTNLGIWSQTIDTVVDMNGTTDYLTLSCFQDSGGTRSIQGGSGPIVSWFEGNLIP